MRPARPDFSSGPCAKRPGWTPEVLKDAAIGRSHRSKLGKKKIVEAVDRTRALLAIPADYRVAIVPASDTGAVEMALWSLLGARPVDMLTWESFGEGWVTDVAKQLKLKDARVLKAPYGQIADLQQVDWTHVEERTRTSPFARAFFTLGEGLGIVERKTILAPAHAT
jgi:phosphoserine aminotransferase